MNIDSSKYDAVLVCNINDLINEGVGDDRFYGKNNVPKDTGKVPYLWYDDPRLYASNSFGKTMLNDLNSFRTGYSAKVSDFGKWVTVEITYHNHVTGRSASKTFLVVFDGGPNGNDPGGGIVLSTANKWRTISGYGQAVSYIKSAASSLESSTSSKL